MVIRENNYLDITDFVNQSNATEERVVYKDGEGQLIYKSGSAKPKLEHIIQKFLYKSDTGRLLYSRHTYTYRIIRTNRKQMYIICPQIGTHPKTSMCSEHKRTE